MDKETMSSVVVATPKPSVQVACVCEKVLREANDVPSLIRIVDTYRIDPLPSPVPAGLTATLPLTIFVSLKSDAVNGEHVVGLRLVKPDGTFSPVREWPLTFNGGEHGVSLQVSFGLESPESGLYWFDVLWAGEELTRIPLRVQLKTAASPESKTSEPIPPRLAS